MVNPTLAKDRPAKQPPALPPDSDGDAGGRGSPEKRRPHRKVTKPKVAGRAHESPRPPPLDDAKFDPGEPELKSISQWWPVDTELSPFVAAPKVSESLSL